MGGGAGGGYVRHRKSSSFSSIFSIFGSCCSHGGEDMSEDGIYGRKMFASDEDGRLWTAEPGIDRKASAFIDRFRTRVTDSDCQTFTV